MSIEKSEGFPFIQASSSASLFGKDEVLSKKSKRRVDVMELFRSRGGVIKKDARFYVSVMEVPTDESSWRDKMNFKWNYVKVNIHEVDQEDKTIALNVNSLAKRLGLTPKEIRKLAKAHKLEKAIIERTKSIDSNLGIIDKYIDNTKPETGKLSYKEDESLPFSQGLSARSFIKMLDIAQKHAEKLKQNPNLAPEVTIKEGWFQKHRFIVISKEDAHPGEAGHHIFSANAAKVTVLGKGGYGTASKIQSIAGDFFALKYANTDPDNPQFNKKTEEAIQTETTNLAIQSKSLPSRIKGWFQSAPITGVKVLKLRVMEIGKDGKTRVKEVRGYIGKIYSGGDLLHTLSDLILQEGQDLDKQDKRKKICHRLGDILSSMQSIAHGDIKPENFFMDKDGLPVLADMGGANLKTNEKGYVPPITRGKFSYTKNYITLDDLKAIKNMLKLISSKNPDPQKVKEAIEMISKADVYAIGATMFTTFMGRNPYKLCPKGDKLEDFPMPVENWKTTSMSLRKQLIDEGGCDKELASLIVRMIDQNPSTRITQEQFRVKWKHYMHPKT